MTTSVRRVDSDANATGARQGEMKSPHMKLLKVSNMPYCTVQQVDVCHVFCGCDVEELVGDW